MRRWIPPILIIVAGLVLIYAVLVRAGFLRERFLSEPFGYGADAAAVYGWNGVEYVYNVVEVEPANYADLQELWPIYMDGRRLQWISELDPAPGYERPVWLQWTRDGDVWTPPVEDLANAG